jgi:hypothetical protein
MPDESLKQPGKDGREHKEPRPPKHGSQGHRDRWELRTPPDAPPVTPDAACVLVQQAKGDPVTRAEVLATLGRAIAAVHKAAGDCHCRRPLLCESCICRYDDAKLLSTLRHAIRTGRVTLPKPSKNHD